MFASIWIWLLSAVPNLDHPLPAPHHHPADTCRWAAMGFHDGIGPALPGEQ